jgi:hypothetical protein
LVLSAFLVLLVLRVLREPIVLFPVLPEILALPVRQEKLVLKVQLVQLVQLVQQELRVRRSYSRVQ